PCRKCRWQLFRTGAETDAALIEMICRTSKDLFWIAAGRLLRLFLAKDLDENIHAAVADEYVWAGAELNCRPLATTERTRWLGFESFHRRAAVVKQRLHGDIQSAQGCLFCLLGTRQ